MPSGRWELGASGHGPIGSHLAERICQQIRVWERHRSAQPAITAGRVDATGDPVADTRSIRKRHTRLDLSFPDAD